MQMLKFWRHQPRNYGKHKEPTFGADYMRSWVKENDFKMKKEAKLEPVSSSNLFAISIFNSHRKDSFGRMK
jgi:hypothetical protein